LLAVQMLSSLPTITTTNDSHHLALQVLPQSEEFLSSSLALVVHLRTPSMRLYLAVNFELMLNMV
jgi:hypothetical protein